MDLGRRLILWHYFRSSTRAVKYVQRKQLKELEEEFPPWYTQKMDEQIGRILIIAVIRSCVCCFVTSIFGGGYTGFFACFAALLHIETFFIHGLSKRWYRKHPGHLYATPQAREEARARVGRFDAELYRTALHELIALYDVGRVFENVSAYRDRDPTRVRVEVLVEETRINNEKMRGFKYPPSEVCYLGYEELLAELEAREQEQKQRATTSR